MDNHTPGAVFPVMVVPAPRSGQVGFGGAKKKKAGAKAEPVLKLAVAKQRAEGGAMQTRYCAVRLLVLAVFLERSSVDYLLSLAATEAADPAARAAAAAPRRWLRAVSARDAPRGDAASAVARAAAARVYIGALVLHPVRLRVSFLQTPTASGGGGANAPAAKRVRGTRVIELLRGLASLRDVEVRISSFKANHVFEPEGALGQAVARHAVDQLLRQLVKLAGSMQAIGNPIGLTTSIGTGVVAVFYEPAAGAMSSPQDLVLGLGKGATSLVSHVIGGALASVAGVGDAATRSVALLANDEAYAAERERRRQAETASASGALDGLAAGGGHLARGIAEGLAGIVAAPVKGAQKGGVLGAGKGLVTGLLGAVVKPVVGAGDAAMSVVSGVANQANNVEKHKPLRLRRALLAVHPDSGRATRISPYSPVLAAAQAALAATATRGALPSSLRFGDAAAASAQVKDSNLLYAAETSGGVLAMSEAGLLTRGKVVPWDCVVAKSARNNRLDGDRGAVVWEWKPASGKHAATATTFPCPDGAVRRELAAWINAKAGGR